MVDGREVLELAELDDHLLVERLLQVLDPLVPFLHRQSQAVRTKIIILHSRPTRRGHVSAVRRALGDGATKSVSSSSSATWKALGSASHSSTRVMKLRGTMVMYSNALPPSSGPSSFPRRVVYIRKSLKRKKYGDGLSSDSPRHVSTPSRTYRRLGWTNVFVRQSRKSALRVCVRVRWCACEYIRRWAVLQGRR